MNPFTAFLNGYRLVATEDITKRVQKRTHKKWRINKKWLKKYGYKDVPDDEKVLVFENYIYATPKTVKRMIEQMKGGEG